MCWSVYGFGLSVNCFCLSVWMKDVVGCFMCLGFGSFGCWGILCSMISGWFVWWLNVCYLLSLRGGCVVLSVGKLIWFACFDVVCV